MKRKEGNFSEAIHCASQVIAFRPNCFEAYWARAKARKELDQLEDALADLREAIKLSPKNMKLHQFTMQVKAEIEGAQQEMSSQSDHSSEIAQIPEIIIDSSRKNELESEV
jgi:tetratricopeptide (TPR) repeat protein